MIKTIRVTEETWQKITHLKADWKKSTMNEVVEELLKK